MIFQPQKDQLTTINEIGKLKTQFDNTTLQTPENTPFQKGGTSMGLKYYRSFLKERHKNYMYHISKPLESRKSCSRLSPYLAWGNLSIRQVLQGANEQKKNADI